MTPLFVQLVAGNCVGKSSIAAQLKLSYAAEHVEVLGKYKKSEVTGFFSGGVDGQHDTYTNEKRFQFVKQAWMKLTPVIVCEGMMLNGLGSFLERYQKECQPLKMRKMLIVHLTKDRSLWLQDLDRRSKGKPFEGKRLKNCEKMVTHAASVFRRLQPSQNCVKAEYHISQESDYALVTASLQHAIEEALGGEGK